MSDELVAVDARTLDRLAAFIRRAMLVSVADEFSLFAVERRGETLLARVAVSRESDPDDLAKELVMMCECDAGDATRHKVTAGKDGRDVGAYTLARKRTPAADRAGMMDPSLAKDAWVTNLVRQNQDMTRLILTSAEGRERALLHTIDRLTERNGELESVGVEYAKALFEFARGKSILEAEQREQAIKGEVMTETLALLKDVTPKVVDGAKRYFETRSGIKAVESVAKVLATLDPEKLQMMRASGLITDAQYDSILEAYDALADQAQSAAKNGAH